MHTGNRFGDYTFPDLFVLHVFTNRLRRQGKLPIRHFIRRRSNEMSVKQASSSLLLSSSTTGSCGSIQNLPFELIRKILYEFILSSPHSEDKEIGEARGCYKISFQYCYGKATLRAFLMSSKRVFHQWGRVLNYINLDIDHTTRYARDESFRNHVRSLVEDPKRQLGLHLRLPKPRVVEEDNAFIANCNHVHHIYHDGLEQHQYILLNDVAILMGNSSLYVEDISVFTNNKDVAISTPSIQCIDNSSSFHLGSLEYLTIYHASHLTRIEGGLPRLRYLHLNTAYNFVELSGVPTLEHLELHDVNKFTTLRDIDNLKEVRISSSHSFTAIEQFRNVSKVSLSLAHVKDISSLTNVRDLTVVGCAETGWHALQENCEKLTIYYNSLKSFEGLTFKKLRYLKVEGCRGFESFSNVNHVKEIHLKRCDSFRDISPLSVENGGKVEKIHLESCPVQDLRPLKGIKDVTVIGFNVNQFKSLGHHKRLALCGYYKANSFPKFENVKYLSIASCDKFSKVDTNTYNSYYGLKFYECRALKSMSSLPNLVELVLDNMYGMSEFNSLGFPSLKRLEIISCSSMKKIILPHLLEHFAYERSEGKAVEIKLKSKMQHIEVSGLPASVTISYFEK